MRPILPACRAAGPVLMLALVAATRAQSSPTASPPVVNPGQTPPIVTPGQGAPIVNPGQLDRGRFVSPAQVGVVNPGRDASRLSGPGRLNLPPLQPQGGLVDAGQTSTLVVVPGQNTGMMSLGQEDPRAVHPGQAEGLVVSPGRVGSEVVNPGQAIPALTIDPGQQSGGLAPRPEPTIFSVGAPIPPPSQGIDIFVPTVSGGAFNSAATNRAPAPTAAKSPSTAPPPANSMVAQAPPRGPWITGARVRFVGTSGTKGADLKPAPAPPAPVAP